MGWKAYRAWAVGSVRVLLQAVPGSTCYKMPQCRRPGMVQMTHAAWNGKKIGLTQGQRSFLVLNPRAMDALNGHRTRKDWPHAELAELAEFSRAASTDYPMASPVL
jgi:hypothetical protein